MWMRTWGRTGRLRIKTRTPSLLSAHCSSRHPGEGRGLARTLRLPRATSLVLLDPGLRRGFWAPFGAQKAGASFGSFRIFKRPCSVEVGNSGEVGNVFWDATDSCSQSAPGPVLLRQRLLWEGSSSTTLSQPTVAWKLPLKSRNPTLLPTTSNPIPWLRTLSSQAPRLRTSRSRSHTSRSP